jgi:ferredoxin
MPPEMFFPLVKWSEGFEALKRRVIAKGFCTYCGACASFCEHIVLNGISEFGEAKKVQVSKGRYIVRSNGQENSCKVAALEDAIRNNCFYCEDFTVELA